MKINMTVVRRGSVLGSDKRNTVIEYHELSSLRCLDTLS